VIPFEADFEEDGSCCVVNWMEEEVFKERRVSVWERYLQMMYFGRVYYYPVGSFGPGIVCPIHWNPVKRFVPGGFATDMFGTVYEYDSYQRATKTIKSGCASWPMDVLFAFKSVYKPAERFAGRDLPERRMWLDREVRWW
jgi:hypothetical protein